MPERRWSLQRGAPPPPPASPTPLPVAKIALLVMVLLGDIMSLTVVLPMTPFLVARYHDGPDSTVGYYSGLLGASYSLGQLIMNPFWGSLSDKGRRPVMLFSLVASAFWIVAFGSSTNLHVALFCRFANGLCSGNVVVAKAMMADLTDSSNETKAFTFIGMAFGIGGMLGPLIGGPLSEPADKYPNLPGHALWEARPFLLPCLIVALYMLVDWILAIFLLEETVTQSRDAAADAEASYGTVDESNESQAEALGFVDGAKAGPAAPEGGGISQLLRDPTSPFKLVCTSFAIFSTCMSSFLEVFPIFARAKTSEGGMGLSLTAVGLLQAGTGVSGILVVAAGLFPMMCKRYGVPGVYARALVFSGLIAYAAPPILAAFSTSTPWLGLIAANLCVSITNQLCFGTANLMMKNSAPPELAGAAIGTGSSIGLLGMAIGPIWGGSLFAYSSSPDAPLGVVGKGRLFFVVLSMLALTNGRLAFTLPPWPADGATYSFRKTRRLSCSVGSGVY
mmetsp:Transcript_2801/g.8266  ORF Transcript_2801/g.8266 Transcript_2801/m.8266 type:complete len:506 (+) Transcript_2801:336-1853(+)